MSNQLPPEKQALHRAAQLVGGQAALAALLGYADRRNVWPWFNTDRQIPVEHCPAIEAATKGQVMRWDLRPHDWNRIWPELVGMDGAPAVEAATTS